MRLDAAVVHGTKRLSHSSESARLDAELLLCRSIDVLRSYLFSHPEDELDAGALERFDALLKRRANGEPMAYISGVREFWSHEFVVTPATLVPRPETELLVDLALRQIPHDANWQILDLGTGSGAIAVAIASERPMCAITATDISDAALIVAQENARQANITNVRFDVGDWTAAVAGQHFNMVVSNPPYVREDDAALAALHYEPRRALVAGPDGLKDIRLLASDTVAITKAGGWLLLEHGADQSEDVSRALHRHSWVDIACHKDLAGLPRVTVARRSDT